VRVVARVLLAVCSILILSNAGSADAPDRPDGVDQDHWIPISDSVGLVIDHPLPPSRSTRHELRAVEGYFAVKQHGAWWRVDTRSPAFVPTSASR
jgi:hypothetical protein